VPVLLFDKQAATYPGLSHTSDDVDSNAPPINFQFLFRFDLGFLARGWPNNAS